MATLIDAITSKPQQTARAGKSAKKAPRPIVEVEEDVVAPVAPQAPLLRPQAGRGNGPSLLDTIWGVAAGYSPNDTRRRIEAADREVAAKERMMQAQQGLASYFGGGGPQRPTAQGVGGAQPASPTPFDPRTAAPMLLQAASAGVDISDYMRALEMARPDVEIVNGVAVDKRDAGRIGQRVGGVNLTNVNGHLIDPNDPRNTGKFLPEVGPGMELVYDASGTPMVRPVQGYSGAVAGVEGATTAARLSASNPLTLTTVEGPNGAPITTSISSVLGGGGVVGQSPTEAKRTEAVAAQDVAREGEYITAGDSARGSMPTIRAMRGYLSGSITGVGANQRLQIARAQAALGNEDAQRQVTNTQNYQREASRMVTEILKALGSNPTDADREYMDKIQGKDITQEPETLAEGLRLAEAKYVREMVRADEVRANRGDQAARARVILHQRGRNPYESL